VARPDDLLPWEGLDAGSYGPEGSIEMSERISFSYEEIQQLRHLLSEARESLDEEATEDEYRLSNAIDTKVSRAFNKARRKRELRAE
jgi:GH18 family chitinase